MARPKKIGRESSFVTLRTKAVSGGRQSFYLDIYKDGTRSYEFLKLYLVPETTPAAKVQNQNAEQAAKAIRNQREIDIIQGKGGIAQKSKGGKTLLLDWLQAYTIDAERNNKSNTIKKNIVCTAKHIEAYKGKNTKLADIDEEWCKGFIEYLSKAPARSYTNNAKTLAKSTASVYFSLFVAVLSKAVREKLIPTNPATNLDHSARKPIKADDSNRPYLTIDEVKALIATDCRNKQTKSAFLFACFTGLRISDIRSLKWSNIVKRDGFYYISIVMKKTRRALPEIVLNNQALKWMPKKQGTDFVFSLPEHGSTINGMLKRWAKKAGITKDISFHVSRHTFATMELTLGADLYTVSKLLGHTDISTTQIYADIINKKRDEAVGLLDNAFNGEGK